MMVGQMTTEGGISNKELKEYKDLFIVKYNNRYYTIHTFRYTVAPASYILS